MPITVEALLEIVRASRRELTVLSRGRPKGERITYVDGNDFESRLTDLLKTNAEDDHGVF